MCQCGDCTYFENTYQIQRCHIFSQTFNLFCIFTHEVTGSQATWTREEFLTPSNYVDIFAIMLSSNIEMKGRCPLPKSVCFQQIYIFSKDAYDYSFSVALKSVLFLSVLTSTTGYGISLLPLCKPHREFLKAMPSPYATSTLAFMMCTTNSPGTYGAMSHKKTLLQFFYYSWPIPSGTNLQLSLKRALSQWVLSSKAHLPDTPKIGVSFFT